MAASFGENAVLRAAEVPRDELIAEIDRISASPGFIRSERLRRFLRHVADRYLAGDLDGLKEYSIGLAVFDRGDSYDPRLDPIVRVEASRLRSRLREYYDGDGRDDPLRIQFEKGSYVPVIARPIPAAIPEPPPQAIPAAPRPRSYRWALIAALLALGAWNVALEFRLRAPRADAPLWAAFLQPAAENYVIFGSPLFFMEETTRFFHRDVHVNEPSNLHSDPNFREMQRRFGALQGPRYDYTEVGDAIGLQNITAFLARRGAEVKPLPAHQATWEAVRNANIVFLGSLRMDPLVQRLPVQPDFALDDLFRAINRRPQPGEPSVYPRTPAAMYAVVSRLPGLRSGRQVLILTSHSSPGTAGAVAYVTQPDTAADLARRTAGASSFDALLRVWVDKDVPVKTEYLTHHIRGDSDPVTVK
jgi:hypothetical protein